MYLSIFAATCRPDNIICFLDNLKNTAHNYSNFEVLLKLDEGSNELIELIENYKSKSPLNIKYLATPKLEGYYTLEKGYNELLKIVNPETYFCWLLTDEIRFETEGWDERLKAYMHFYPDDIFRIKLSIFKLKNYNDLFECMPCPDNYALTTLRWLQITGGWGEFWGPDSWHQCIDYYLGLCQNSENPYGVWRSIPCFDVKIGGQEAGQGISDPVALRKRSTMIIQGWRKHTTFKSQLNYYRFAQRLNCHITALQLGFKQYILEENFTKKTVSAYEINSLNLICTYSFKLSSLKVVICRGNRYYSIRDLIPADFYFKALALKNLSNPFRAFFQKTVSIGIRIGKRSLKPLVPARIKALVKDRRKKKSHQIKSTFIFNGSHLLTIPSIKSGAAGHKRA